MIEEPEETILYKRGINGEWAEKPGVTRDWIAHVFVKKSDYMDLVKIHADTSPEIAGLKYKNKMFKRIIRRKNTLVDLAFSCVIMLGGKMDMLNHLKMKIKDEEKEAGIEPVTEKENAQRT